MAKSSVPLISGLWLPFIATVGASVTVLAIQSLDRYVKEHRQRIYAIGYMADVAYRFMHSELLLQKHTIAPHIEAVKRMLAGDRALIDLAFDTDEFDILSAGPMSFTQLPPDHQLLVGYDDIHVVQAFDTLCYLHSNDSERIALRSFVEENLKSKIKFASLTRRHQKDILNIYWDYLHALEHEAKRLVAFVFYIFSPMLQKYSRSRRFKFFSTKSISQTFDRISELGTEFNEFIPSQEFFEESRDGGIQNAL